MVSSGNGEARGATDPNGELLLEGVAPVSVEQLIGGGHRWASCPDFNGAGVLINEGPTSLVGRSPQIKPVVAIACRCGAVALVQLG